MDDPLSAQQRGDVGVGEGRLLLRTQAMSGGNAPWLHELPPAARTRAATHVKRDSTGRFHPDQVRRG
jgi:hypothetical protein